VLDPSHPAINFDTQAIGVDAFAPGHEIYVVLTASTAPDPVWIPPSAKIRVAVEIKH
jgi:hypothetical protein